MWYFKIGIGFTVILFILLKVFLYKKDPMPKDQFIALISMVVLWPVLIFYMFIVKQKKKDEGDSGTNDE